MDVTAVAALIGRSLGWEEAKASFEHVTEGVPFELQGVRPQGLHHSLWELLEHVRITQADILEFCTSADYHERAWPAEYWPTSAAPPDETAWPASVAAVQRDRSALAALLGEHADDPLWPVPGSDEGQPLLREALLVLDHTSYHVGQMVTVRTLLGVWG